MTDNPLRILLLGLHYAPEQSGNGPYTAGLAAALAARGHHVTVRTGYPHYPAWRITEGYAGRRMTEHLDGVTVERFRPHIPDPLDPLDRARMEASFGLASSLGRWHRPDVILCVSPALLATAVNVARARATPRRPAIGVWVQDLYGLGARETGTGGGRAARALGAIEARTLRSADGVAAIHQRMRDHMVRDLGVDGDRVRVIRNWTHLVPMELPPRSEARAELGWDPGEIIALHAGNMGAKQGLDNVIEAARAALRTAPRLRFVLLGDGNQRPRLEQLAEGMPNVTFVRPLPERGFRLAMAAADVLVLNELPGLSDMAVPSKLTSYFTTGRPVVAATDAASVTADEIRASAAGIQVDPTDPAALARAIVELATDARRASSLGKAGQEFCRRELSQEHAIDQYEGWLRDLVARRRPSHPDLTGPTAPHLRGAE
ncbi:glycosyltransferase family 4 protein [Lolliginicoccus lacisalsi]|uniref:glycosyltransferase family 4 protein n=1 Tax=Lolliginicoccus lacisalsi TaxID=2742202 RepID=UPI002FD4E2E5